MNIVHLLFFNLGLLSLLHFVIVPRIELGVRLDRSLAVIGKSGFLALLQFFRTFFLISTLSSLTILCFFLISRLYGGTSTTQLAASVTTLQSGVDRLDGVSSGLSLFLIVSLIGVLALIARRNGKKHCEVLFQRILEDELERLTQEQEAGDLKDLPPTNDMQQLDEQIAHFRELLTEKNESSASYFDNIARLEELRNHIDLMRRVNLNLDPDALADPPPKNRGEKVRNFFMSRGLLMSLRGSSRAVFLLGLLLLIPSLLGFQSGPLRTQVEERIIELNELQVFATEKESRKHLEQSLAAVDEIVDAEKDGWGKEDEDALDVLARSFEDGLQSSGFIYATVQASRVSIRATAVRHEILGLIDAEPREIRVGRQPSMANAPKLSSLDRQAIKLHTSTAAERGPRTALGRKVRQDLAQTARHSSGFRVRLRAAARAFQSPARIHDVSRLMATEILGQSLEAVEIADGPLRRPITQLHEVLGPDRLRRAVQVDLDTYKATIAEGKSVNEAIRSTFVKDPVRARWTRSEFSGFRSVMKEMPRVKALSSYPPSLASELDRAVDLQTSARVLERMKRTGTASADLARNLDHLASYEDHFPGQLGSDTRTPRAVQLAKVAPESSLTKNSQSLVVRTFERARSAGRLRGFARVGGVLIGVDPKGGVKEIDVTDLGWQDEGSEITLVLETSTGATRQLGPYPKSLVYRALTYAADSRPVTVTIISAPPLADRKILLHPALLDTPVGCRAIELDQFVFKHTEDFEPRKGAQRAVEAQADLYRFSWAVRALELLQEVEAGRMAEEGRELLATVTDILENHTLQTNATLALHDSSTFANPQTSLLMAKSEFFDADLVRLMQTCASSGSDVDTFSECLGEKFRSTPPRDTWMIPPPDFGIFSGVREEPFTLRDDLSFLDPDPDRPLWLLDLVLQVAFFTPSTFGDGGDDENPWEFPSLAQAIRMEVQTGMKNNPQDWRIYEDMRDFTILQRIFRLALAERFGKRFPLENLIDLGRKLAAESGGKLQRTLRWDTLPGYLETTFDQTINAVLEELARLERDGEIPAEHRNWIQQKSSAMRRCRELINTSLRSESIPIDRWGAQCSFKGLAEEITAHSAEMEADSPDWHVRMLSFVARQAEQVDDARQIRSGMAVEIDDRQAKRSRSCAAL